MAKPRPTPASPKLGRPPTPHAAYRKVAEDLRRRMRHGEWPPGTVLPSWRTLAAKYKVGVRVLQHAAEALKRDGLISISAQRRMVARDWDSPGTALETRILVLMTTNPSLMLGNPLADQLMLGIAEGAGELKSPLQIAYDDRLRKNVPAELLEAPLRGVVIMGKIASTALRQWEKIQIPVVLADQPGRRWKLHSASADNVTSTREMVRRALELGHRQFAFVRRMHLDQVYDVDPDAHERQLAFEAALAECGIKEVSGEIFSYFPRDTHKSSGIAALFKPALKATCILTSDPGGTHLIMEAAAERGLNIPRHFSLATYGTSLDRDDSISGPRFDFRIIGRTAAKLTAEPRNPVRHELHAGFWHEGKTWGPAPKAN